MAKLLIIEDEPSMQLGLKDNMELEGYLVETASDGEEGLSKIKTNSFDLVLLDVMLPKLSGFDVCKAARSAGISTPIVLLTARGEEIDKILGLEFGADDYITKPFSVRELLARVKAILRRSQLQPIKDSARTTIGRLNIDFESFHATENQIEIKLSHKEFEILSYLHQHKNQVVSRYDLLEKVWGYDEQPTTRTVDNFVVRLRQKVELNPNQPRVILTVHGTGYKLVI
ncbi:MAG: response regulator transcription factor [Cytophagales bacterium]|jgi:DNA-binding response OmpR family regulator|nr:response regulator transcription factor [Cytophagales bacterium]MCA6368409.1 response regulator transcription factor [Cytophagales bacterium]MCA6371568.1 response regulator transcription factor [Cytophagales bacterium]MCA6377488.1 response regulator transcription factor [Cytophagales bacterium]MCA6385963.1 response regulator transcription factor [Cytophagales bacterium]